MWLAQGLALSAALVLSALAEARAQPVSMEPDPYYEPAVSEPTYPETSGPIVGVYALASAYTIRDRFQGFEHPAARGWIRRPELRRGFRAWLQHDAGELRMASGPAPGGHARHRQPKRSHLRRGSGPSPAGYVESSAASPGVPTYTGGFVGALPLGGDPSSRYRQERSSQTRSVARSTTRGTRRGWRSSRAPVASSYPERPRCSPLRSPSAECRCCRPTTINSSC